MSGVRQWLGEGLCFWLGVLGTADNCSIFALQKSCFFSEHYFVVGTSISWGRRVGARRIVQEAKTR